MGYSCPVCGDPQADDEHLANHLAFTAMIRSGDHEAWLDEHVPEWSELGEDELGEVVSDLAEEEEYPQVFEDTTDHAGAEPHEHAHDGSEQFTHTETSDLPFDAEGLDDGRFDESADDVLSEARELTRQRREQSGDETAASTDADGDAEQADAGEETRSKQE